MTLKVNKRMCATCPWQENSPHADLVPTLEASAVSEASRICHSTGDNAINQDTGKPERLCRGARDFQLRFLCSIGFLHTPTDEAWEDKCRQMKIKANQRRKEDAA